ncbi:sensor histidine kinase [Flavobacterium tructae]|uniref:ATP-binding protein n=1 Tax=Flavobacterium tructae TaxID=1114873 RepID=UPI0035A8A276
MKKIFLFILNKTILKYLLALLVLFLLGNIVYLSKSFKNETEITKKHSTAEIRRLLFKADALSYAQKFDGVYYYCNKAQALCDTSTQYIDYVYAINYMADVKQIEGDYIACESLLTKTLPHLKKIKKTRFTANVYESFAANYYYLYDYNNALLYLTKALHLKMSTFRKIGILNSICQIYIRQKKFKLAESILISLSKTKIPFKLTQATTDAEYSRILDNLGLCYQAQQKPEALACYQKSIAVKLRINDNHGLIYGYMHVAEYYQESNHTLAVYYAKKSLALAKQFNDVVNTLQSLKILSKTSNGNDLKKYSLSYIKLTDSITHASRKTKNQFTYIKYTARADKNENLLLKAQKVKNRLDLEKQKNLKIISYTIIAFILNLFAFVYFYLKSKEKKQKSEAAFASEIRISKKLHDELAQDVYQTLKFSTHANLKQKENKELLLNNLNSIYSKARNISKENSSIVTNENYSAALKEMISGFKTPDLHIILNDFDTIIWNELEKSKKIILHRILQELFGNMKKHSQATLVSLTFKNSEKKIVVIYSDNGVGAYNKSIILKNGLQNVENRIKTINGNIIFDTNSKTGFKLSFNFPK